METERENDRQSGDMRKSYKKRGCREIKVSTYNIFYDKTLNLFPVFCLYLSYLPASSLLAILDKWRYSTFKWRTVIFILRYIIRYDSFLRWSLRRLLINSVRTNRKLSRSSLSCFDGLFGSVHLPISAHARSARHLTIFSAFSRAGRYLESCCSRLEVIKTCRTTQPSASQFRRR